jgi:hypothetical protein
MICQPLDPAWLLDRSKRLFCNRSASRKDLKWVLYANLLHFLLVVTLGSLAIEPWLNGTEIRRCLMARSMAL